ncbi:MAG: TIGR04086 family membrane protein [Oscillospiraceae bacterium]|jgi:putative membrane protein (TIGR04086 family)|nr:TIGR04086 family membrane protein [Oscillospiraceae bacterium]
MPQKEEAKGYVRLIVKCALISLAVTVIILALASLLVTKGVLAPEWSVAMVLIAEAAGAFAGGRLASRRAANRKLPAAALTGFCVFLFLLIAGFLFAFPPARHGLFILLAAVLPAMAGGLQSPGRSRSRR